MPISSDTEEDTQGMLLALCVIAYNVAVSIETTWASIQGARNPGGRHLHPPKLKMIRNLCLECKLILPLSSFDICTTSTFASAVFAVTQVSSSSFDHPKTWKYHIRVLTRRTKLFRHEKAAIRRATPQDCSTFKGRGRHAKEADSYVLTYEYQEIADHWRIRTKIINSKYEIDPSRNNGLKYRSSDGKRTAREWTLVIVNAAMMYTSSFLATT